MFVQWCNSQTFTVYVLLVGHDTTAVDKREQVISRRTPNNVHSLSSLHSQQHN